MGAQEPGSRRQLDDLDAHRRSRHLRGLQGSGRCVAGRALSRLRGPVFQQYDAGGECGGPDQVQVGRHLFGEEALAIPLYDGIDEEPVNVDEPGRQQGSDEGCAAGDDDVLAGPPFEGRELLLDRPAQDGGALPVGVGE